jgi:hypothetical protein
MKNGDETQSDIARCLKFSHRDVTSSDGAREIAVESDDQRECGEAPNDAQPRCRIKAQEPRAAEHDRTAPSRRLRKRRA